VLLTNDESHVLEIHNPELRIDWGIVREGLIADDAVISVSRTVADVEAQSPLLITKPERFISSKTRAKIPKTTTPGATGLSNLGNTCFMNSALQCLSHTPGLTSYFLSPKWRADLNPSNPLGSRNASIATEYAALLRELWDPYGNPTIQPRNFKKAIGEFNSIFASYFQQDSQEFVGSLLDALHEDLNRVHVKPYIPDKDTDGMTDAEAAQTMWDAFKGRNDSIVVELFMGAYKSNVRCCECAKRTVKFDPYMFLPIPIPRQKLVLDIVVQKQREKPRKFATRGSGDTMTAGELQAMVGVSGVLCEISKGVLQTFEEFELVPRNSLLVFYEISRRENEIVIPVYVGVKNVTGDGTGFEGVAGMLAVPKRIVYRSGDVGAASRFGKGLLLQVCSEILKGFVREGVDIGGDELVDDPSSWAAFEGIRIGITKRERRGVGFVHDWNMMFRGTFWVWPLKVIESCTLTVELGKDADEVHEFTDDMVVVVEFGSACFERVFGSGVFSAVKEDEEWKRVMEEDERMRALRKNKIITLYDCIEEFTREEVLGNDDTFYCGGCKGHRRITKKIDVWNTPDVLVFTLKRFQSSRSSSFRAMGSSKIEIMVDFPVTGLDLGGDGLYDLFGVSNHMGGIGGGHCKS